ncbi:MAG TPA: DUF1801 domain-containing protein [Puia sp.]|nr:DUF1801 domain-containing protein [Puia sp.]
MRSGRKFKTVDEYISSIPTGPREKLQSLRKAIKQLAPEAEECISYNMPAFKLYGVLVYYAAYPTHIGFYPTASPVAVFKKELEGYELSKGTVRFPLDKPLPMALIKKMVKFKVSENRLKAELKVK